MASFGAYQAHMAAGALVLVVMLCGLVFRWRDGAPPSLDGKLINGLTRTVRRSTGTAVAFDRAVEERPDTLVELSAQPADLALGHPRSCRAP